MRKRKRKRLKKKVLFILILIILIIAYIIYMNINVDNNEYINSDYSDEAITVFETYNTSDKLSNYNYSKTLEEILINDMYNELYLTEYLDITYLENDTFLEEVNTYLNKGYNANEVNSIYYLSDLNQEKIKNTDYVDFLDYIDISNFNVDNISRYESYSKDNDYDINTVVTYVNIYLDYEFYEEVVEATDPSSFSVLVNKYHSIGDYEPENLVGIEGFSNYLMVEEAAEHFELLMEAASIDGFTFEPNSTYRSYSYQYSLFNYYCSIDGAAIAATYSAMAGHSEHQTGLAVDIYNPTYYYSTGVRLNDEDYAWILENSYKYGYIVRYPVDSIDITGYIEEPWHLRYLGVELATSVAESGLTYDEYYDLYLTEY